MPSVRWISDLGAGVYGDAVAGSLHRVRVDGL